MVASWLKDKLECLSGAAVEAQGLVCCLTKWQKKILKNRPPQILNCNIPFLTNEGVWVEKNGLWGFVSQFNGKEVIICEYRMPLFSAEELAWLVKNNKYGCVDMSGNIIVPFICDGNIFTMIAICHHFY
jgi:WG containing repeat